MTFGHEANTCLSAMVNEIQKTVVVRTTAGNETVAVMTTVTDR